MAFKKCALREYVVERFYMSSFFFFERVVCFSVSACACAPCACALCAVHEGLAEGAGSPGTEL